MRIGLPASAQHFIQIDYGDQFIAYSIIQSDLGVKKSTLRIQHIQIADYSEYVPETYLVGAIRSGK